MNKQRFRVQLMTRYELHDLFKSANFTFSPQPMDDNYVKRLLNTMLDGLPLAQIVLTVDDRDNVKSVIEGHDTLSAVFGMLNPSSNNSSVLFDCESCKFVVKGDSNPRYSLSIYETSNTHTLVKKMHEIKESGDAGAIANLDNMRKANALLGHYQFIICMVYKTI